MLSIISVNSTYYRLATSQDYLLRILLSTDDVTQVQTDYRDHSVSFTRTYQG